jgi:PKD domain
MATACVLVGLLIAPAAATAGWLPAVDLSKKREFGFDEQPQIAVDASGGALAVWPQLKSHYVIQASTKIAGGTWGPLVDISPPGEESIEPRVAMNAAGHAIAVWIHLASQRTVKTSSRTPQGNWGPAEQISIPGHSASYVDVAIDPAGNAVAIWTQYGNTSDYIIEATTRSPGGQWTPPVKLSEGGHNAWSPQVAIDSSGHTVAVWHRWNDAGDTIVQVAEKDPGEAWSETEDLSLGGAQAVLPMVAISDERTVVVWERNQIVEAAAKAAGGNWQKPVKVSGPGSGVPAVGMDSDGNAVTVWNSEPEIGYADAELASLPVGGKTWTKPITLSERLAGEWGQPKIAVDPAGRAMAIWTAWDGTARVVEAVSGTVRGGWENPVTISPPGSWSRYAQIAMDSAGNAAAVWRAADPPTMQAALFDVTKPELSSVSIPSSARAGRPISFAASPFDAWSPTEAVNWSFGDSSTAAGPSVVHSFQEAGQFHVTVTATDAAGHSTTASAMVDVTPALATSDPVISVRNGRAHLRLHCPGTAVCHGSARLASLVRVRRDRLRWSPIGKTVFEIPAEAQVTVTIKLNRKGRKLVSAARKGVRLRAKLMGNAVEPRIVVLKPIASRPYRR